MHWSSIDPLLQLERLKLLPPTLSFRSKFQYCNPAYEVAPMIVERLTSMPFTEYVSRELLEPFGMGDTSHKSSNATALGYVPKLTPDGVRVGEVGCARRAGSNGDDEWLCRDDLECEGYGE
jgi:CubicO group peptidase (beta-lactamase class C family)